jgi:hypothetical protein
LLPYSAAALRRSNSLQQLQLSTAVLRCSSSPQHSDAALRRSEDGVRVAVPAEDLLGAAGIASAAFIVAGDMMITAFIAFMAFAAGMAPQLSGSAASELDGRPQARNPLEARP